MHLKKVLGVNFKIQNIESDDPNAGIVLMTYLNLYHYTS